MGRLSPADFHAVYGFRRPNVMPLLGSTPGLRSRLSLHPPPEGAKVLPVCSLHLPGSGLSRLGSGLPFKVSPNLRSSTSPVSQASTLKFLLSLKRRCPQAQKTSNSK